MNLVHDPTGAVHLTAAILALISGTAILILNKATNLHKRIGYVYCLSMIVVFITSFMIYRLFNGFGLFHYFAIIGTVTLLCGMVPILFFKKNAYNISLHLSFMYWSVVGLYGAFVSELFVRLKITSFYNMIGITVGLVMLIAGFVFYFKKETWEKNFT